MKILQYGIILGFMVFGSACASVGPSFVRDGMQVYEAKCPGTRRSIADCHKMAARKCNGSYREMDQSSSNTVGMYNGRVYGTIQRSLMFTCGNSGSSVSLNQ